ncbi:hypothetical protein FRAHR75_430029 [Frankia sp. Hr75.2]|nr:hypothetical protein FRAHR75_430029 [Frankia sp. Hr75.2]
MNSTGWMVTSDSCRGSRATWTRLRRVSTTTSRTAWPIEPDRAGAAGAAGAAGVVGVAGVAGALGVGVPVATVSWDIRTLPGR